MPVPKKRQSKSRKNIRKYRWKQEPSKQVNKALSKSRNVLKEFFYKETTNILKDFVAEKIKYFQ